MSQTAQLHFIELYNIALHVESLVDPTITAHSWRVRKYVSTRETLPCDVHAVFEQGRVTQLTFSNEGGSVTFKRGADAEWLIQEPAYEHGSKRFYQVNYMLTSCTLTNIGFEQSTYYDELRC